MRFGIFLYIWRTPRTTAYFKPTLQYGTTRLAKHHTMPHYNTTQHNIPQHSTVYTTPPSTTTLLKPHSTVQDTAEQHNVTHHSTPYLFATRTTRHNTPQRGHITRTRRLHTSCQTTTRIVFATQYIRIHHIGLHYNTPRQKTTTLLMLTQLHSYPTQRTSHHSNIEHHTTLHTTKQGWQKAGFYS